MKKLRCYFKTLSLSEWGTLKNYILSPVYCKRNAVVSLYRYLYLLKKKGLNELPAKREIWEAIFDLPYKDGNLRKYMSELSTIIEQFLIHKSNADTSIRKRTLAAQLIDRELYSIATLMLEEIENQLLKNNHYSEDDLYTSFVTAYQKHQLIALRDVHDPKTNLPQALERLEKYYLYLKLKSYCELLNQETIVNIENNALTIESLLNTIERKGFNNEIPFKIYALILNLIQQPESVHIFRKLKYLVETHGAEFNQKETRNFYLYLINYCSIKINAGDTKYHKESFGLYKTALKEGVLFHNGFLSPWSYKNILELALRLSEIDWAADFIENYRYKVDQDHSQNAYNFGKARFLFHNREFEDVPSFLSKVNVSDDVFYFLNVKRLYLKTYYELGNAYAFHNLVSTLLVNIRRNKTIKAERKEGYINMIRFSKKLIGIETFQKDKIVNLQKEILKTKNIVDRAWLKNKVSEKLNK